MIKNLIFDYNGTLVDDVIITHLAVVEIFKALGLEPVSFQTFREEIRLPYMDFYKKFTNASKEIIDKLFLEAIQKFDAPDLFPGVKELLEYLNQRGINMIILSSHPKENLEKEIEKHGIQEFFINVVSTNNKAKAITELMKDYTFLPKKTAYVGDMFHDIEVGKKAKVTTVAVSWGYHSREKLEKANPDYLIDDLKELETILNLVSSK